MSSQSAVLREELDTAGAVTRPLRIERLEPDVALREVTGLRRGARSRQGEAAINAVTWGILERVGSCERLRIETIPATWPMTRHLVRRITIRLVENGLLERMPDGAVRLTAAGQVAREAERRRRGE